MVNPGLQFVLTEIDLGLTFAQSALTAYQIGASEHGDSARASAIKALETAKRFIRNLDAEDRQIARAQFPKLEQALTTLSHLR